MLYQIVMLVTGLVIVIILINRLFQEKLNGFLKEKEGGGLF